MGKTDSLEDLAEELSRYTTLYRAEQAKSLRADRIETALRNLLASVRYSDELRAYYLSDWVPINQARAALKEEVK